MSRRLAPVLALLALALAGCAASPPNHPQSPELPTARAAAIPTAFDELGRADAPLTMIEFSDLQCPFCARFALQTFAELRRNYIDTGKIHYAAHDLPLSYHPFAVPAAVAARCAGEQGKFWEYRHELFVQQSRLGAAPYAEIAQAQGLDVTRFESCRTDGRAEAAVRAAAQLARSQGITSTPTFMVGRIVDGVFRGEPIEGAKPYSVFAARLDALLAGGK